MLLLSVIIAFSAVACGGGGGQGGKSVMFIKSPASGTGVDGLKEVIDLFEKKFADYSFAPGKTGIEVELDAKGSVVTVDSIATDGVHCYIQPYGVDGIGMAKGEWLCLDEIFKMENPYDNGKTIESKIGTFMRERISGVASNLNDGKKGYYLAPNVGFYGGLTYDKRVFDEKGLYFVNPSEVDVIPYYSYEIMGEKEYLFVEPNSDAYEEAVYADDGSWNSNHYLTCGPDGIYETYDDGMPSSLEELVVVCDYMNEEHNVKPFVLAGKATTIKNQFSCESPMINSLLGEAGQETIRTFEGEDFPVVTGYQKNTELWGMANVQLPIVEYVDVTESHGYYTTWSVARYYTTAFWNLAVKRGWYTNTVTKNKDHLEAEADLIFSGFETQERDRGAFMCDASYWVTESRETGNFIDFAKYEYKDSRTGKAITAEERENDFTWLSLPRVIEGQVTEGNGTDEIIMRLTRNLGDVYNAMYSKEDFPEDYEIIKQWLLFFYSDEIMNLFTAYSGALTFLMDYEIDTESEAFNGRPFAKKFFERFENAIISADESLTPTFFNYPDTFYFHYWDDCWTGVAGERASNFYMAFKTGGYTVHKAFEERLLEKTHWEGYYQAEGADGIPPTAATGSNGKPVEFTKHW